VGICHHKMDPVPKHRPPQAEDSSDRVSEPVPVQGTVTNETRRGISRLVRFVNRALRRAKILGCQTEPRHAWPNVVAGHPSAPLLTGSPCGPSASTDSC